MVSIIGMSCEFAGPADSIDNFYRVILESIDATASISNKRWKVDHSELPSSIRCGGYLRRDPWEFDPQFFNIAPKEATRMDPQHRYLLEHTYHALEDAHISPDLLKQSNCGVFIGLGNQDYARLMHDSNDFPGLHSKGSLGSMAAGRISYHFDCTGPTFVVDTACSSSLVALHQAMISLKRQECDLAIVGGATHILTLDYSWDLSNANMLSQDGKCKAFSKLADGFSRGEGVGVIILQRREDAVKNKRRIYADLLGSAINGDGRSNGITAPSQEAQQRLLEHALHDAGLKPEDITFIETHGTGTNLGDKIEFSALSQVFKERKKPLYLGSVKANIAHCEAAAGIAGIIKSSLCIYHKKVPPHRMADSIDPAFSVGPLPAVFLQKPLHHDAIIAGVSSYGMSGSNAHVILGPHAEQNFPVQVPKTSPFLLFLSAKTSESFTKLCETYRETLSTCDEKMLKETLDQANLSRKHWPQFRKLIYGANRAEILERLAQVPEAKKARSSKFALVLSDAISGEDSQFLYENISLYREIYDAHGGKLEPQTCILELLKALGVKHDSIVDTRRTALEDAILRDRDIDPLFVTGQFFDLLDELYVRGRLDVSKLDLLCNRSIPHKLPPYPFNRTRWIPDYAKQSALAIEDIPVEQTRVELAFALDRDSALKDHVIHGAAILPGSYYLETATALFEKSFKVICAQVKNVSILKTVILKDAAALNAALCRKSAQDYEVIFSQDGVPTCQLTLSASEPAPDHPPFPQEVSDFQSTAPFYENYAKCGVAYGPLFKMLTSYARIDDNSAIAEINAESSTCNTSFFARFLDSCFQSVGLCLHEVTTPYAPIAIAKYHRNRGVSIDPEMWCYARIISKTRESLEADLTVYNAHREAVIEISGLACRTLSLKGLLHEVVLKKIKNAPDAHVEFFPEKPDHLIHVVDGIETSPFLAFQDFYQKLKSCDNRSPGALKTATLVCISNDVQSLSFARACALSFPTEFPHIAFRCLSYDSINSSNRGYVLGSLGDGIPFGHVLNGSLYQYETAALPHSSSPLALKTDGYYLVTGGFGGVGKHVIQHLIHKLGIKKIIVASRHQDSIEGVDVLYKPVDLSSREDIIRLFQEMPRPLYGIFHLAGTNIDQPLSTITENSFQRVAAAKLEGARLLDALSRSIGELEHFVLFSSMAALVSSPGQFAYTYANLGLQALAEQRVQDGLPATVIAWGPWEDTGMMAALSKDSKSSAAINDFSALPPRIYLESLTEVLSQKSVHPFAIFQRKEKIARKEPQAIAVSADVIQDTFLDILVQETESERSKISMETSLGDLGVDSINTIRIRADLQSKLLISIPISLLFDDAKVGAIIDELRKLRVDLAPKATPSKQTDQRYPLSYNQFSIWYEQQAIPNNIAYFCSIGWKICGAPLAIDAMKKTWDMLLEQNDMLRAVLENREGELGYRLLSLEEAADKTPIHIEKVNDDVDIGSYLKLLQEQKLDLDQDLSTRVHLLHHRGVSYFMLASHHIFMDAASMFTVGDALLRALCGIYPRRISSGSYHDFVLQQKHQSPEFCRKATDFMMKEIFDADLQPRKFLLPQKDAAEHKDLALGKTFHIPFSEKEMQILSAIPQNQRVHLYLSAWALLLARYSGESEILIGMAFNGRTEKKWSETIGHFVNVLPLCVRVDQTLSCAQYIQNVKQHLFELMEFQDFPLAKLLADTQVKKRLQGSPLLQTYFNYFDASQMSFETNHPTLDISPFIQTQQEAQFDMSLWIVRGGVNYAFDIKYRAALFSEDTLQSLAEHYKTLVLFLSQINHSKTMLKEIQLVSHLPPLSESINIHDRFVYDHFMQHVVSSPHAIAIEQQRRSVDYKQLSQYVDELAEMFQKAGASGETVAILVPDKANIVFLIAVLMLWKEGFAYLPLNTHHPVERIKYMMEVAGCSTILNVDPEISSTLREHVMGLSDVLALQVKWEDTSLKIDPWKEPKNRVPQRERTSLAYILFTSGSTGLPKGVLIEHNGLIDRLLWMKKYFQYSPEDKYLQSTVLTFDISVPEFCLPLISGGTCVLFGPTDPHLSHAVLCSQHQVTMMSTVPSLFSVIQEDLSRCNSLKRIILVGEILPPAYVNKWIKSGASGTLYNLYGPTEVTIYATYYPCRELIKSSIVPIGAPCDHVVALVLDSYGNMVPKGVTGELYLAGKGVARGYIGYNKPTNPFQENPHQELYSRMYRTGDFVRWQDNFTLEYLGRKDHRIKLNGLLIELGEIEQLVVQKFSEIINAAALIVNVEGVKHIVLCIMPVVLSVDILRAHLEARLPNYMLPWKIVFYPDFPRSSSNKIDRKALVQKVLEERTNDAPSSGQKAKPTTQLGRQCIKLWEEILNKEDIGIDENFFDLGGDSLLLTKLILLAERRLSIKLNFAELLQNPTINGILKGASGAAISWHSEFEFCRKIPSFGSSKANGDVLLTGATGHLGIHMLRALLQETKSRIYAIVRGEGAESRLCKRFVEVFATQLDLTRLHVIQGDLTSERFGLENYEWLCQQIATVIHTAAVVNHALDYTRLKSGNVVVTKNVIKFAQSARCKQIWLMSTQFTEIDHLPAAYLPDEHIEKFTSGYEQTKFFSEVLARNAVSQGYPIQTLRLPLLIDCSDPHLLMHNHFVALLVKCIKLGYYPESACAFSVLPTEQIAKYVAKTTVASNVLNCLPHSITLSEIFEHSDFDVVKIDFPSWRDRVIASTPVEDPFFRLLPLYTTEASPLRYSAQQRIETTEICDAPGSRIQEVLTQLLHTLLMRIES